MNRASHLQWAKDRALALVKQNDLNQALMSIISDLGKHPELQDARMTVSIISMNLLEETNLLITITSDQMISLIEGIN